jgi:hypothetical protein
MIDSFFAQIYASKRLYNFHMLINSKKGANWLFWGHMGVNFDHFFWLKRTFANYYKLLFNSILKAIWKITNSFFSNF